ncbi:Flp pilus assembly protein CpaB [Consotaella aegiceratis]|uniref:Flp pilus assembly protein CpaB n=1 Tax=Consotaella aegiceratis TaxID=3097961 RepID=UPI002F403EC5
MIRIVILIVAIACGGLAAWLTLTGEDPEPVVEIVPAPPVETTDVLVAAASVGMGTVLDETMMAWKPWPAETVSEDLITRPARPDAMQDLAGSMVRSQFTAGEPIREDKLAPDGFGYMSALLPPGKRAAAVRISAETTAGGFVLPDDRVDVVQTIVPDDDGGGSGAPVSRTILRNIRVLAVDQTQQMDPADPQKVVVGRTATLELDPRQVEVVNAAQAEGTLSLALRSIADRDEIEGATARQGATVRVHRDGKVEVVQVSRHTERPGR